MTKRKVLLIAVLFALIVMAFAITVSAAENTPVRVKVQTSVGSRELTTTVGKLFTITTVANSTDYSITGIKSFDNYSVTAIKEIHIPFDATRVTITSAYPSVDKVIFDDYSNVTVSSLTGLTKLTSIQVGASSNITFESGCLPNNVATMDFIGSKSNIKFGTSCFESEASVKTLNFGADSKYSFGQNCFKNTSIENLVLTDGATFTFDGTGAFANCTKLKYAYIGKGVTEIKNSPFDGCEALEMVYINGAISITDNAFRSSAEKAQLKVYIHTTAQVAIGTSAFAGRSSKGVVVCVLATNITSLSSCKYELHVGIQHAYTPAHSTPTCYTSYVTDCPCGQVKNAYYKLYASNASAREVKIEAGSNPGVPHDFSKVDYMSYDDGIFCSGVVSLKCKICDELEGIDRIAAPLVDFAGYSVTQVGAMGMVVGIRFNSVSIGYYEQSLGKDINFGMVLAAKDGIGSNNPLDANGNAISRSVYKLDMEAAGIFDGTLKLTNFTSATVRKEFVLSGYIKIGSDLYYIQGKELKDKPIAVNYTQIM